VRVFPKGKAAAENLVFSTFFFADSYKKIFKYFSQHVRRQRRRETSVERRSQWRSRPRSRSRSRRAQVFGRQIASWILVGVYGRQGVSERVRRKTERRRRRRFTGI
jgi:hypothetical protein